MYNCASGVHPICMYAGKALPRNKTLEQLGFTESPELELREKIGSKTPSREVSPAPGKQLVSENVHCITV